jgi:hypothetical protein
MGRAEAALRASGHQTTARARKRSAVDRQPTARRTHRGEGAGGGDEDTACTPWSLPGRLRAAEGGSDEPVVGRPDAAQRRPVRRRRGLDRLGARSRLAGDGSGGLPERARAHTATGGPPAAGAPGRLPRLNHRLRQQRRRRRAHARHAGRRRLARHPGWLGGLAGPIQRRLVAAGPPPRSAVEALRARWCGAHRRRAGLLCPGRRRHSARGASSSRSFPSWAPSTVWPTSAWRWRSGLSTPTTTGSVCSSSRRRSGDRPRPPRITLARRAIHRDHPGA